MRSANGPRAASVGGPGAGLKAPSPHQAAVFAHVGGSTAHAVVMATAGSGKTTTLVEVARRLPTGTRACFLAFNRSTAAELRLRLPAGTHATTIHALGRAALVAALPEVGELRPDAGKYRRLATELLRAEPPGGAAGDADVATYLARLAHLARLERTDTADLAAVADLQARYGLERPVPEAEAPGAHALLRPLLERGAATAATSVDFTDMVHLPLALGLPLERFDFVCVDEAQDLSRMTLALVLRLVDDGARALFVGDERQAIYAFAGADRRSLAHIREATGAAVLPLSVSFRCPVRHVTLARRFAPEMTAATGAGQGSTQFIAERALPSWARPGDLVMSRTNAPLVATALALASAGTPTAVLGDDLAEELLLLAGRVFAGGGRLPADALRLVERHALEEARRLEYHHMTRPELPRLLERSADAHRALSLVLTALPDPPARSAAEGLLDLWRGARPTFPELEAATRRLFEPTNLSGAVVLSTIHKAKGREAARVFLLRPELLALGTADPEDEAVEANVLFVALTRAKRELVFVEGRRGAVRERLRRKVTPHAHAETLGRSTGVAPLERRWDEILRLALVMAAQRGGGSATRRRGPPVQRSSRTG